MKRRAFCASAISTLGVAALPFGKVFSATATGSDISAVTGDGRRILLRAADVADFAAGLRGELLLADSAGYDDARRVWNGMFNRKPALIARCAGAADIVRSVQFARAHDLLVAVRGGGHSLSAQSVCDDGLMIDCAPMRSVRIDPQQKRARVEPGVLLGGLDREALPFGLVTTTGTVSHTGAAGLTLGGGTGRLSRRFELTCDNVTAVDIVTADGKFRQASAAQTTDLFWGVRGGGGNFGVVTSFEYRLHPFDGRAFGGQVVFPLTQARDVMRGFWEAYSQAPDELWIEPVLAVPPGGERIVMLDVCYTGPIADAERVLAPYRKLGRPVHDDLAPIEYRRLQSKDDKRAAVGRRYYNKSGFITALTPELIDVLVDAIERADAPNARFALAPNGGASARVARDANAFWHRDAQLSIVMSSSSEDPAHDQAITAWARAVWPAVEAFTRGFYANTNTSDMPAERIRGAYGGNYERLVTIKNKYDPTNLFRLNANITPTASQ